MFNRLGTFSLKKVCSEDVRDGLLVLGFKV